MRVHEEMETARGDRSAVAGPAKATGATAVSKTASHFQNTGGKRRWRRCERRRRGRERQKEVSHRKGGHSCSTETEAGPIPFRAEEEKEKTNHVVIDGHQIVN